MAQILRSVGITIVISGAVGGLFFFTNGTFIGPFVITSAAQFIIFFMWNSGLEMWKEHLRRQTDNEMYREFTKIGAETECSFCGEQAYVPVNLGIENRYTCQKCNRDNRVVIEIRSVQTTEIPDESAQDALKKTPNE